MVSEFSKSTYKKRTNISTSKTSTIDILKIISNPTKQTTYVQLVDKSLTCCVRPAT